MDGESPSSTMKATHPAPGVQVDVPLSAFVYDQLRRHAEQRLRDRLGRTTAGLTWQPTVLVNETLLRMLRQSRRYHSDGHFLATATAVMKNVLVDYVRERLAQKRRGRRRRIDLDPASLPQPCDHDDLEADLDLEKLFAAVQRMSEVHPRAGQVASLRLIWSMTIEEIAGLLEVSRASIERDWRFARAWLRRELSALLPE